MKRVKEQLPKSDAYLWAQGCANCKLGIVSAPELTGACELYLERLVQAIDGDLKFCDCHAGKCYQAYLKNRFVFFRTEAKGDYRMSWFAERNTHPDIEAARRAMQSGFEYAKVPSIRWVNNDYPVPPEAQRVEVTA